MVVDFHTHCFTDILASRAIPRLASSGLALYTDGTASDLCRSMKGAGISLSVVLPVATRPKQVREINNWAAEQNAIRSSSLQSEQLLFFGAMHPDMANWREEIRRIKEYGLRGIKFHPDSQGFFVDEDRMFPVYEALFQEGMIILFHAGVDPRMPSPVHCTPERLANVLHRFPGGRIVAAHMGGLRCWDDVANHLVGKEIYFDTAFSFAALGVAGMTELIRAHGSNRVLFGTDSPWVRQKDSLADIQGLGLQSDDEERILSRNALSLLGLEPYF